MMYFETFYVKYDKVFKWAIYRRADDELMEGGFSSKAAAETYLDKEYSK